MSESEKLVYVMNHFSSQGSSHFTHVIGLLNELAVQGVRIRLIIEKGDVPAAMHERVDVILLTEKGGRLGRMRQLLDEIIRAQKDGFNAVFVRIAVWSALVAIVATRARGGKVFFWQSGTTIEFDRAQPPGIRKLKWYFSSRLPALAVWRWCDRFVTGPEPMLDYYATVGRVKQDKLRLLYNDVDLTRFDWGAEEKAGYRAELRARLGVPSDGKIMLFVHRLSPVRRTLDYLPLALRHARDSGHLEGWFLVVAGGGADLPELIRRSQEADLGQVVLPVGEIANLGIESLYAAADLFVQPSHAEGFPRVLVEAMAAGLPIVTTDAGGSGQLLGEKQQEFVTPRDEPQRFSEALAPVLSDAELRAELAAENLKSVQRFATPQVALMYRNVIFGVG